MRFGKRLEFFWLLTVQSIFLMDKSLPSLAKTNDLKITLFDVKDGRSENFHEQSKRSISSLDIPLEDEYEAVTDGIIDGDEQEPDGDKNEVGASTDGNLVFLVSKRGRSWDKRRRLGSEFLGKRNMKLKREISQSPFIIDEKKRMGSEFLGKRRIGSEFLGKRRMGSEFLGKRRMGSEFLGKRRMGSEFLGKRKMGSEFLGKRRMGSEFLGKRRMGSEFLGKRRMGSEFLGKRRMGSEFLGKRGSDSEILKKRRMGSEFLGKRNLIENNLELKEEDIEDES